jgi:hypothetical protein
LAALAAFWLIALSPGAGAATLQVGPGQAYALPSAAAAAARDGDRVVIAAGTYKDCAVWRASNLVIEGAGPDATVIADKTCMGKALFVTEGSNITVQGMTLSGARVPDFNGAGIRAEGGDLTVRRVRFTGNQDGLLAGAAAGVRITVSDSAFLRNGTCEGSGGCAHGIYVGKIALLRIERSRFAGTRQGHHIKSRALRTEVTGCDLADGTDGTSSYAIDIPNGGAVLLRDNRIEKGPGSSNRTAAVSIGEEGAANPTSEISIAHDTFLADGGYGTTFVVNLTATPARLTGNTLQGPVTALRGDGTVR